MKQWLLHAWELVRRSLAFVHHELWEMDLAALPQPRRTLVRFLRTVHLVVRGIKQDNIPLHASALTLGTLISIVPVIAITFSMYKGLGAGEKEVQLMVVEWMEDMPTEFQEFVLQMIEQYEAVNVAAMGGIFLVVVLFIVIKMLGGIEEAFNRVWYISNSRNMLRKISNYISVLVIVPILIVAAGAASAMVEGFLRDQLESMAWIWRNLLRIGPLLAVWLAFSFLYIFVPNTRVKLSAGLISGLVGAIMWQLWQHIYISFQVGVANYNAIYGTFASVPIFLGWLYVSWIILLLGAEVSYAIQNADTYKLERSGIDASAEAKWLVALGVVQQAARALSGQGQRFNATEFARENHISVRLVNEMVRLLERAGLMAALADQPGEYVLLKAPQNLPLKTVLDRIFQDGTGPEELGLAHLDPEVRALMASLDTHLAEQLGTRTVQDLLESHT